MSKRRKAGDLVIKKANAGFVGESSVCRIQEGSSICMLNCGDDNCREWYTLWDMKDGVPTGGVACHVSECEMEDAPAEALAAYREKAGPGVAGNPGYLRMAYDDCQNAEVVIMDHRGHVLPPKQIEYLKRCLTHARECIYTASCKVDELSKITAGMNQ